MKTHELKTWHSVYELTQTGRKPFEIRRDDRGFSEGDILLLREWDPGWEIYTGRECRKVVTLIVRGWGLPPGMCVMAIADEPADARRD